MQHPLPKDWFRHGHHTPTRQPTPCRVSTITLRGTIASNGRPPLSVTQDGVTIKGGRIVSGRSLRRRIHERRVNRHSFRCDHIGRDLVGLTDNPIRSVSRKIAVVCYPLGRLPLAGS